MSIAIGVGLVGMVARTPSSTACRATSPRPCDPTTTDGRPEVSAIVVLYNSSAVLPRLLQSIPAASSRVRTEVVVVDNASADRAESRRIATRVRCEYLQLEQNLGYGGGVNAAVARLTSSRRLPAHLQRRPRVRPGAIDDLVDYAPRTTGIGSVGPVDPEPRRLGLPLCASIPSLRVGIGHALLGDIAPRNRWSQRYREESTAGRRPCRARRIGSPAPASGADGAIPRLGGFDEGYFMYFEDVDLGDRLRTAGGHNVYVPRRE